MLSVETAAELPRHVGAELGRSAWVSIDQPMVDAFAGVSRDSHWIHVDTARAEREMPGGAPSPTACCCCR